MNRIVHFEIQVDDFARAEVFYSSVFGWTFADYPMGEGESYRAIMTAPQESKEPGINGGMVKRQGIAPKKGQGANSFVCTVQVAEYDAIEEKILAAGGTVALPKFAIPGMAWQGYYIDTEGNTFGIHAANVKAK